MGRKCCVPNCSSNYEAALKSGIPATSTFKFPDDPTLHDRWVKAIGRPNWMPSKLSSVCIHHFNPADILKYDKPAKLKPLAVPCLFGATIAPGQTSVLRKRGRPRKVKDLSTKDEASSAPEKPTGNDALDRISCANHVIEDCILTFENFKASVHEKLHHCSWVILPKADVVHLFSLDDRDVRGPIRIENSIKVYSDLKIKLFTGEVQQTDSELRWILGADSRLLRWSQLTTIVDKYDAASRCVEAAQQERALLESRKETLDALKSDAILIEEHLEELEEELDEKVCTTVQLEIEEQVELRGQDDNFIDIGDEEEVKLEESFTEAGVSADGTTDEPLISTRKPIAARVRELHRAKFKCFVCNTEHGTREDLERHLPTHLSMLPYACTRCTTASVTIQTVASLNKHFLMHRKPLKCRFCDVRFTTYASRVLHEDSKHGREPTSFTCDVCHREFSSKRSYRYHRKIHDDPEALRCKVCDRSLSSAYEVKLHMRTHTGEKPNNCPFCTACFNRKSNLTEHVRRFHSMERPYCCAVCGERFRTNVSLKRHQVTAHGKPRQAVEQPRRVARTARVLQCKDCDRKFTSHVSYHSHRRQHDKRYQCSYCGIRIAQLRDFEDHENSHTGARPYECGTCGKTFRTSSTYYGHLLVHGSEKKHFCRICNKGFLRYHHVLVHMRTHTGEKPYRCDVCGRMYADKSAFKRHQLTHRPTVGDMLRAKELTRSITSALPVQGGVGFLGASKDSFDAVNHPMDLVFASGQLLSVGAGEEEEQEEETIGGVLPGIMPGVLDGGGCPVVYEYLAEDSYMTDLQQMITSGEGSTITVSVESLRGET